MCEKYPKTSIRPIWSELKKIVTDYSAKPIQINNLPDKRINLVVKGTIITDYYSDKQRDRILTDKIVMMKISQYFKDHGYEVIKTYFDNEIAFKAKKDGRTCEVIILINTPDPQSVELSIPALMQIKKHNRWVKICIMDPYKGWGFRFQEIDLH